MSRASLSLALLLLVGLAVALSASRARAQDSDLPAHPPLKHAFADFMVGTWKVEADGPFPGKGTATIAKGVGGTALIEDLQLTTTLGARSVHGVYRASEDGASMHVWQFDTSGLEPLVASGPLRATDFEVSSETGGGVMRADVGAPG